MQAVDATDTATAAAPIMSNKAKTPEVDIVKRDQKQKQSCENELQS